MINRAHGVLYVGVTADLHRRIWEHRNGLGSTFCRRYGLDRLALVEEHATTGEAIAREKSLKRWRREWKIELIERQNPEWEEIGSSMDRAG